jgi:hypothetical protein
MTKLRALALGAAVVAGVVIPCVPASASTPASAVAAGPVAAGPVAAGPVACKGGTFGFSPADSSNFIANIIDGAFAVARVGMDAVQGIADTAVGAGYAPGARC